MKELKLKMSHQFMWLEDKTFFIFQIFFIQYVSCQISNAVDSRVQLVTQCSKNDCKLCIVKYSQEIVLFVE